MRRAIFWTGWTIVFLLPIALTIDVLVNQDMPVLNTWKLALPVIALVLIVFGRSRDDVLKHHLV